MHSKIFFIKLSARPALYVGEYFLKAVSHYIAGYCHGLEDTGHAAYPLAGWIRWVELRFLIFHPGWHWTSILLHIYGSDQATLDALPALYEEFFVQRSVIGVEGIEAELKRQLIATYGEVWHEPETTTTSPLSMDRI